MECRILTRFGIGLMALIVVMAVCQKAFSYERTIKAEWTKYVGPTDMTVAGFQLYQDGAKVCTFTGKDIVAGECKVNLLKSSTNFTLSALFVGGKESPQSQAFVLQDIGQEPQGLKITVVIITAAVKLDRSGAIVSFVPKITQEEVPADAVVKAGTTIKRKDRYNYVATTVMVM